MARLNLRRIYGRRWMSSHQGPSIRVCWGLMQCPLLGPGIEGQIDVPTDLVSRLRLHLEVPVPAHSRRWTQLAVGDEYRLYRLPGRGCGGYATDARDTSSTWL